MYISPSRKIGFVHIQKTGGSTIEFILSKHISDFQNVGSKHSTVREAARKIDNWDTYFSFTFVRNPWDRLVSWYSMIEEAGQIKLIDTIKSRRNFMRYKRARQWSSWKEVIRKTNSFDKFVRSLSEISITPSGQPKFARNQLDYLLDEHGNISVDFIGRLENFQADVETLLEKIEISPNNIKLSKKNKSKHNHYSQYYSPETRDIVEQLYQRDIEHFGYEFEEE